MTLHLSNRILYIPAFVVVVAAMILKLCLEKLSLKKCNVISCRLWNLKSWLNLTLLVDGHSFKWEKDLLLLPLIIMYARTAATALTGMLVLLTNTSTPLPSWFILDAFKWITSTWGDHGWSIVTLPQLRWFFSMKVIRFWMVILSALKEP